MTLHAKEDEHRSGTRFVYEERPCLQLLQRSKDTWELREVVARQDQLLQAVSES